MVTLVGSLDACHFLLQGVGEECRTALSGTHVEMDPMLFSNVCQTGEVVNGSRQLQSAEADVVQRLVIQQHALVRVLDEQVEADDYAVWLHLRVGTRWVTE